MNLLRCNVPYAVRRRIEGQSMPRELKVLPASFYRTLAGTEPVRYWLLSLDPLDRKHIGVNISCVEYGWPTGMPACRPMKQGLGEIRTDLSDGGISRICFCIARGGLSSSTGSSRRCRKQRRQVSHLRGPIKER